VTGPSRILADLEAHGFPIGALTSEQQEVLLGLTIEELELLTDIRARLDEAGPDFQAHGEVAGAALF
jgi:hypothetical protein